MTRSIPLFLLFLLLTACTSYSPEALREQASALETQQAAPYAIMTQEAEMTAIAFDRQLYMDNLTATAGAQMLATQAAQATAVAQAQMTVAAQQTQQAEATQQAQATATQQAESTQIALTQEAFRIQQEAEAERVKAWNRLLWGGLATFALAMLFLAGVRVFDEYLQDRREKRKSESIRARMFPREGASPLFITQDERPIDPDRAFYPDASKPAPNDETQERVTQRAQSVQLAREFGRALGAAPGHGVEKYLAAMAQGAGLTGQAQLPPRIDVLDAPPVYAEEVEAKLIESM